ncbi:MAG TPA: hypothetical protein VFD19_00950, partial [Clostridia bacterium]|nr:hypothetical protein [Clostridia bacterium]
VWSVVFILARTEEEPRLAFLTSETVEVRIPASIAILSDAIMMEAPVGGLLLPLVEEGARVAKDGPFALIVPSAREDDVRRYHDLKETHKARLFMVSGFADLAGYPLPLSPSDSLLRESLAAVGRSRGTDQLFALQQSMRSLRYSFGRALSDAELFAAQDTQLASLSRELDGLLASLESDVNTQTLRAPISCGVNFVFAPSLAVHDAEHWEWEPNPQKVIDQLANDSSIAGDVRYAQVAAGQRIVVLRKFSAQSLMAFVANNQADGQSLRKGDRVDLYHDQETVLSRKCLVTRIVEEDGLQRVFLLCDALPEHILHRSVMQDVSLVALRVTGLRVPLRSLMNMNADTKTADFMRITGGVTQRIRVNVLALDDRYAVIGSLDSDTSPLREADLYVVNPWTIGDGKLID